MSHKRKFHRHSGRKPQRGNRISKIKPGADSKLKKIFSQIGIPESSDFKPDPFQVKAVKAIRSSDVLVTAPTGSGKTWIAETAVKHHFEAGRKSWYASPLKALTNGIYSDFSKIFGNENVGILTGDRKENPDAPIIIGTTEILRNQLYDAMHHGVDLTADFVVLDEAHFLGDEDRGVVWEETLIYLPVRIPLLMLSATIGNADDIAGWISTIRGKKCTVIAETRRPVPLHPLFFHPSGTLFPLLGEYGPNKKTGIYKKVINYLAAPHPPRLSAPRSLPPLGDIIRVLRRYRLLPAIFFMKSRADCDQALELCTEEGLAENPERKADLKIRIDEILAENPHLLKHKQLWHLEHLGVASHHSGQLPSWKIMAETLMAEGYLDAIFATSTVAAGVNFPARTVVILNSDRFNGTEFVPLNATQLHQMTGRAGRRGKDNIGFAISLPGKFMDLRLIGKLMQKKPEPVSSQIRINFSMVLNLLLSNRPEQIRELLDKSFASYLMEHKKLRERLKTFSGSDRQYLWKEFMHHLNFLKENGYVTNDNELTEDGAWASQLRIDQPLMIAEGFRLGIFPESDPVLLSAIMASFVNEREAHDESLVRADLPGRLVTSFLTIKKALRPFAVKMTEGGFEVFPLYLRPAATIYAFASGAPWEKACGISGLSEGDLARLTMRTADNLRHIRNLHSVFPTAAKSAGEAIDLIMREPVISYYQ